MFFNEHSLKIEDPFLKYESYFTKKKNVVAQCSSTSKKRLRNVFQSLKTKWSLCEIICQTVFSKKLYVYVFTTRLKHSILKMYCLKSKNLG